LIGLQKHSAHAPPNIVKQFARVVSNIDKLLHRLNSFDARVAFAPRSAALETSMSRLHATHRTAEGESE